MKIAQIAPPIERIPPKTYGGTERVVHALTEELVRLGHDVTLFASEDSITSAKLMSAIPKGLREMYPEDNKNPNLTFKNRMLTSLQHVGNAYQHQLEFDIIHDHTGAFGASFAQTSRTPTIMTLHGPLTSLFIKTFTLFKKPYLVGISYAQTQVAPQLNFVGTVYNGLPMQDYPFSKTHKGYLLFVGRICKEKGVHFAVEVAKSLDLPLIIAAKMELKENKEYFEEYIKPYLSKKIKYIGEVDEKTRNDLFKNALCSLHPTNWPEPFGLTLIESMATGCPVIAFNKGSIPEVIADGQTGYVVEDVNEMIEKVAMINKIDRQLCRTYSLDYFNARRMALAYETLYKLVLHYNLVKRLTGVSYKEIQLYENSTS